MVKMDINKLDMELSKEEILENLKRIPLNPILIDYKYNKDTYPIQDSSTRIMVSSLKQTLEPKGMYLCGRFAEWEYANMDVCMGSAMDLYHNKLSQA